MTRFSWFHPASPSKRLAAWPSVPLAPTGACIVCVWSCAALTTMAVTALAVRMRLGVWGARAMQARGFSSERSGNASSGAGAIREAGGAFGKKEQAEEERYFRARTKEQLAALKKHHEDEIAHHKNEIERLQKEIERHKHTIKKLKDSADD